MGVMANREAAPLLLTSQLRLLLERAFTGPRHHASNDISCRLSNCARSVRLVSDDKWESWMRFLCLFSIDREIVGAVSKEALDQVYSASMGQTNSLSDPVTA